MTDPIRSPGAILRAERESLGVTVREVSETLNLSLSVIDALETDDLSRLPGPVFARGYLRAYARLLDLDPVPLLVGYAQAPSVPDPRQGPVPEDMPPRESGIADTRAVREWMRTHPQQVLATAVAAVALVLVLLVVWLWSPDGPDSSGAAVAGASGSAAVDSVAGGESAIDAYRDLPASGAGDVPDDAADSQPETGPQPSEAAPTDGGAPAIPPGAITSTRVVTGTPVRRITEEGDDRLQLTVRADCWVEVKGSDGRVLYSDISRAGSELELVGDGPFRVLLGYAPGVDLSFNGEPIPLGPHTRNNVASLSLGQ